MSRLSTFGQHLYTGKVSFDFVGRRMLWYSVSALIVVAAATGLFFRELNPGIEFKGGVEFNVSISSTADNVELVRDTVLETDDVDVGDPIVTTSGPRAVLVQTQPLSQDEADQVSAGLEAAAGDDVSQERIGPTFGAQILNKALLGLGVFLGLVVLFIWAYFREWKMSVAAIVALLHDVVITVGVYAWSGFEVSPATVTGFLTILGFSLYDTVVVFDKVRENTRAYSTNLSRTYAEQANLAVNQTLVRSINTTVTALLPVLALLVVGTVVLGTGPLKDLALALFVGMAAGAYSSIFIATPLAVQLKLREPAVQAQEARVAARRARSGSGTGGADGATGGRGPVAGETTDGEPLPDADGERDDKEPVRTGAGARPSPRAPGAGSEAGQGRGDSGRVQPQRRPRSQRGPKGTQRGRSGR